MCVVSAVHEQWYNPRWPYLPTTPGTTPPPRVANPIEDIRNFKIFKEILDRLDKIDEKLGLPDCGKELKEESLAYLEKKIRQNQKKKKKK